MKNIFLLFTFILFLNHLIAQPEIELESFATGLSLPVAITHAGDDRLFVVEKGGVIKIIDTDGQVQATPFLDIDPRVNSTANERGLLGLAFHPDYATNGYFFVNYTNSGGSTVISRFSVSENNPDQGDPDSELILLTISQPYSNHNGGGVVFGPDGMLYIGTGDGGSGGDPENRSQNRLTLLGKMLRINPNVEGDTPPYFIPEDNPFAFDDFTLDEIWAIGLRNPWRYSFDRETGDLWIADVGQNAWEEVNQQPANSIGGENYGWRCYEGFAVNDNSQDCQMINETEPIWVYAHGGGFCRASITGGYVYRGSAFPGFVGYYFYADYCKGNIWTLAPDGNDGWENTEVFSFSGTQITAFGEDANGELYMAAIGQGRIYKIIQDCSTAATPQIQLVSPFEIVASTGFTSYQWYKDGEAIEGAIDTAYMATETGVYFVETIDENGCAAASEMLSVVITNTEEEFGLERFQVSPNPFSDVFQLAVSTAEVAEFTIRIRTVDGRLVYQSKEEIGSNFQKTINLGHEPSGIYLLTLEKDGVEVLRKINKM